MHQTFYIGADEEITSIVEKIKRAQASEIAMVVPKRALLIQSIINLRILKKEADERNVQLMIVTQDKLGKILVEKAGILVQQKIDNNDEEIGLLSDNEIESELLEDDDIKGKSRLDNMGSDTYFDEESFKKQADLEEIKRNQRQKTSDGEILVNKELVKGMAEIKKKEPSAKISANYIAPKKAPVVRRPRDKIESFFFSKNQEEKNIFPKADMRDYNLPKKSIHWFLVFGILCASVIIFFAVYLFIPKAAIDIVARTKTKTIDSQILGDSSFSSIDYEKETIPAKIIAVSKDISKSFPSSGDKSVSNQKARGTVTLYNEFSTSPQPLVATTRLLTADGKLFRLVNGITIPGMVKSGDKLEPGKIDAEVVADEAGEEYNIDPATFSIPGFKDSGADKYNKFYAKSGQKMTGGGSGGGTVRSVSQSDVNSAKAKVAADLDALIKSGLEQEAGSGAVLLDEAINREEAVYKLSNSPGEVAENFSITVEAKASAIVFSEADIKNLVGRMLAKSGGSINIDSQSIKLDYGKPDANFRAGTLGIKFHAEGKISPSFDLSTVKKEILGKSEDDLKSYLSAFKDIETVNIQYKPSFMSGRIPFLSSRVELKLDN